MDNLSKDAIEARKAGMSYGKWKASQKPTSFTKEPNQEGTWHICHYCGRRYFQTDNRSRKYCSNGCRYEVSKLQKEQRRKR